MFWDVVAKLSCDWCWEASERRIQAWGLGPITKIWYEFSSCNSLWSKCFVAYMLVVIFRYIQVNLTWHPWLYIEWTWTIQIDKSAKYSQFYFLCQLQSCWNVVGEFLKTDTMTLGCREMVQDGGKSSCGRNNCGSFGSYRSKNIRHEWYSQS